MLTSELMTANEVAEASKSSTSRALYVALASAVSFFAIGLLTLSRAHPEEDAFILFRYVRNVVDGHGIVFNVGGAHAEGATDFLWMILLCVVTWLGIDVAVAAALLNAVGAGIAGFLLFQVLESAGLARLGRGIWWVLVPVTVVSLSGASAAYGGFSSMLYSGLILLAVHVGIGSRANVAWLPGLSLVLGLFRPDGALIGGAAAFVGAVRAWRLSRLTQYLLLLLAAALIGALYFVWRYHYFGLLLPLPLYVKSRIGEVDKVAALPQALRAPFLALPGLGAELHWLTAGGALMAILVCAVASISLYRSERAFAPWPGRLLGALPYVALYAALSFAYQTQNFDWRFQAPIHLGAIYFAFRALRALSTRAIVSRRTAGALAGVAVLGSIVTGVPRVLGDLNPLRGGYLNTFAARFGAELPAGTRIALSEAGRFPFWTDSQVVDIIGLNSNETAIYPVSQKLLNAFDPQILFFHHVDTLDFSQRAKGDPIVRFESARALLRDRYAAAFSEDAAAYSEVHLPGARFAAVVMDRFLEDNRARYDVFAVDVDGDGSYAHVYGFRKDLGTERAIQLIRETLRPENRRSYLTLARERSARHL